MPFSHSTSPTLLLFSLSFLSTFLLFPDKKEDISVPPAVVMPAPSKRGRKSKQVMGRVAGVGGVLPPGSDALILAHLAGGGQVRVPCIPFSFAYSLIGFCCTSDISCHKFSQQLNTCAFLHNYYIVIVLQHHGADPYDLSNDEDDHTNKDGPKSYR